MRSQVAGARLWAVLQKNVRLKLAHPISTILEFLLPVVFLVILVFILALSKGDILHACCIICLEIQRVTCRVRFTKRCVQLWKCEWSMNQQQLQHNFHTCTRRSRGMVHRHS